MDKSMKRRLAVVTGVVVIVAIVALAIIGGASAAKNVTVAEAASGDYLDKKIQVSGTVVDDSYELSSQGLSFSIFDPEGDASVNVPIVYDGAVSATFGNGITAIATGRIGSDGILRATELVTKCPSKYESRTDALGVAQLLDYGEKMVGKLTKVAGVVGAGTLQPAGGDERFVLIDGESAEIAFPVHFNGALSDEIADGSKLIVTGSINADGVFLASDVALEA